jgi:hypothetical protein
MPAERETFAVATRGSIHHPLAHPLVAEFKSLFFSWELWLAAVFEQFALRLSLVTGQELPKLPANAC